VLRFNTERPHEYHDDFIPEAVEKLYYDHRRTPAKAGRFKTTSLRTTRDGSAEPETCTARSDRYIVAGNHSNIPGVDCDGR
jgi:hypothetical protein